MKITTVTRKDIVDALVVENTRWNGRLEEQEFLSRLFDLTSLPSNDPRFEDATGDIWKHRVINTDWDDDWVFYDRRFNLLNTDDEIFLRFLAETIHPVVRPDATEAERLCQLYNHYLIKDGFELVEKTRISGKPIYTGRYSGHIPTPGVAAARAILVGTDPSYVAQQLTRMEAAALNDPALAIGTPKELIETVCKTVLDVRKIPFSKGVEMPELVKLTAKALELTPSDIPEKAKASEIIKRLLSNLGTIAQNVAELRNQHGTGHGKKAGTKGLGSRHAKLAVGAASTLAVFLMETHNELPY